MIPMRQPGIADVYAKQLAYCYIIPYVIELSEIDCLLFSMFQQLLFVGAFPSKSWYFVLAELKRS
jgi:hypothetical protein